MRVQAVVPARMTATEGPQRDAADTTTLNLSVTGMLLKDPLGLELGTAVRVELTLDDDGGPLVVTGTIVREGASDEKGVHFVDIARADLGRLTRFITERQRAELRIAKGG